MKYLANTLSLFRIAASLLLILINIPSVAFYLLYSSAIISDLIDGLVARKAKATSRLGARLDTIGDAALFAVLAIKIIPSVSVSLWIWVWIGIIAALRVLSAIILKVRFSHFTLLHAYGNKIAGVFVAALPFLFGQPTFFFTAAIVACVIASVSATEELLITLRAPSLDLDIKGIWFLRRSANDSRS